MTDKSPLPRWARHAVSAFSIVFSLSLATRSASAGDEPVPVAPRVSADASPNPTPPASAVLPLPAAAPPSPPAGPSLSIGGFIAAQTTVDSNGAVNQNHLISVDGRRSGARFGFAYDATRVNAVARYITPAIALEGRAEADMESAIHFRIRHVYTSFASNGWMLLLGQTDTLVGNLVGPHAFNNDWFYAQGNAYDRTPQLRVSYDTKPVYLALAAVPNVHGASDAVPHGQARVLFRPSKVVFGLAGHFGVSDHVTSPADSKKSVDGVVSYLGSVDASVPVGPVNFSAQVWAGAGGAHGTGGNGIGNPLFVLTASGDRKPVPAIGGFADVFVTVHPKFSSGVAAGASVITDRAPGGVAVPVASNVTAVTYASYAVLKNWLFVAEFQAARTLRALDMAAPATRTTLNDGRFLFGQKLSF